MLPFYGRGVDRYEGDKRKRGGSKNALVAVAAVLGVALIVTSWGAWSSRSAVATAKRDLAKLRNEVKEAEEDLQRTIDTYRHVEGSFHAINRDVLDKTRQLRQKEEELASFRTEKEAKISDCQRKQDEVFDQLAYETEVNDALKRHIHSLEEAHKLRETDWHGLAEKWRKYEEDTINENHRLQTEIRKLQHIEGDARFDDPALPVIEPEDRPEAHWDANFHVPEYHKGEYHHSQQQQQQQQASQQQAPQQQQQQQHQAQQHQQHQQQQQHHQQPVPSNPSAVPVHPQPPSHPDGLRHHDDIYAHHYEDHAWGHDDPLDHYWMHDGFADGHDAFHGDNWHHPPSPHTDEWRAEDHGRVEAHGGWSSPDHAEHGGHHYEDWRAQDGHGGHGAQGAHGGHHDEWRAPEHGQRHDGSHGGHGQDWNNEWHAPDHTLSRDQHGGDRQWRDEPRRDMRRDEVHDDHWKDARRQEPPRRTLEQAQAQGQGHAADMHAQGRDQQHREGRWDDRRPGDRGVDPRQAGGTPQYHPRDDEYRPGSVPVRRKSHDDLAYKLGF